MIDQTLVYPFAENVVDLFTGHGPAVREGELILSLCVGIGLIMKCQLGLMYDTTFPGRDEDDLRCLDLCHEFNQMKPPDLAGREAILRKIMHRVGKNVRAEQNIYISFGCNMEAGDNVFIGPCCGFYTAHHPIDREQA